MRHKDNVTDAGGQGTSLSQTICIYISIIFLLVDIDVAMTVEYSMNHTITPIIENIPTYLLNLYYKYPDHL